jgi:hypothetical protein
MESEVTLERFVGEAKGHRMRKTQIQEAFGWWYDISSFEHTSEAKLNSCRGGHDDMNTRRVKKNPFLVTASLAHAVGTTSLHRILVQSPDGVIICSRVKQQPAVPGRKGLALRYAVN